MFRFLFLLVIWFINLQYVYSAYSVEVISVDNANGTGIVEVTANGRTGPYTVTINGVSNTINLGNTSSLFNDLSLGNHVALIENSYGCIVELPFNIGQCAIELAFFLEGPFNPAENKMNTALDYLGLLPGQISQNPLTPNTPSGQPYDISPWNYLGTEGEDWDDSTYDELFPDATPVDWALMTVLDNDLTNPIELFKTAGVVDTYGNFHFTCPNDMRETIGIGSTNDFYVRIEHRNHMGIMTPESLHFANESQKITIDFRGQDSYKDPTSVGQKQLDSSLGFWGMFAGDMDQAAETQSYDISGSDKIIWQNQNGNFYKYLPADVNMDGDVNGADKIPWQVNNGLSSRVPKTN